MEEGREIRGSSGKTFYSSLLEWRQSVLHELEWSQYDSRASYMGPVDCCPMGLYSLNENDGYPRRLALSPCELLRYVDTVPVPYNEHLAAHPVHPSPAQRTSGDCGAPCGVSPQH